MTKKHFSILLVAAVLVAAAVFLIPSPTGRDAGSANSLLLPDLADAVNDISLVRISAGGDTEPVTLERVESGWVVKESYNYPADWSVLRPLLADLSQAVIVEEKTSNPEYYYRLGVQDPDAEDSESRLIEFPANEMLPGVIVGNSAQNRDGHYLRIQGESPSMLVDRAITLPINENGWLAREIVDIEDSSVLSASITHADGESITVERESTDVTDFNLRDVPEGREMTSTYTINQVAAVLADLQLESVVPVDEVVWEGATELQLITETGMQLDATLVEDEENRWMKLVVSGEGSDEINQVVDGWAYNIPLYKFDAMNKRMEDLLTPLDDESDDSGSQ